MCQTERFGVQSSRKGNGAVCARKTTPIKIPTAMITAPQHNRTVSLTMLELRRVSKRFAGSLAVDNVSFGARPGEITGYLGPNGSGKSTTMKMITGLIEMTAGEVLFNGVSVQQDQIAWKQRMGYVPEEPYLYNHLTGLEYLIMVGQLRDLPAGPTAEAVDRLLQLLGLVDDRHAPMSAYSKGMRQKVLLAAALLHNPEVLLLDEPFSGLDIGTALVLRSLIQELAARGKVVLFSSHELETVERVCSRVVILHRGKVVADDSIEGLRTLMALPTLEDIFSQLAVEQDSVAISREIADVIRA
jgi:ABC-2 type transport system ATP-binding protein